MAAFGDGRAATVSISFKPNLFIPKLCFMKYMIGLVAMLLPLLSGAQSPVKALHIGDIVPDITLTNVYNYPSSTIRLSDLKGKLVILDFWAVWCTGCIQAVPKLDSLQKEFQNKLQVILVNEEGEKSSAENEFKTTAFFHKWMKKCNGSFALPYALKRIDRLDKLFPHIFIPHYVWISEGKVIAITSSEEVTYQNISTLLKGLPSVMHLKSDKFPSNSQN
jgi:thiol-disulfide isomerase/thioredoxin